MKIYLTEKEKQALSATDNGMIELLEYENKQLSTQLKISSVIVSILTSILTTIVLVNIVG